MNFHECEKATIGIILKYPSGNKQIPERIVSELEADKFDPQPLSHRLIYIAQKELVNKGEAPNTMNVSIQLGDKLKDVGGIEYLESLRNFSHTLGVDDEKGFGTWALIVDNAGRLRHLQDTMRSRDRDFEDLEELVAKTKNVDEYLSNFVGDLNEGINATATGYKPIREAGEKLLHSIDQQKDGEAIDIIPCLIPSLERHLIPRPYTLGGILGLSGSGKTSLGLLICLGVAKDLYEREEKGVVSINSLETPDERLIKQMACIMSGIDSRAMAHGKLSKKKKKHFRKTVEYIMELPVVYNDNTSITTEEFIWQATALHLKEKRVLGLSDYSELFNDKAKSEELRISRIVKNHKRVSFKLGSCEILMSQPTLNENNRATKMVHLSDGRYSRAYENDLDWGLVIYNYQQLIAKDQSTNPPKGFNTDYAYVMVEKNKGLPLGSKEEFYWRAKYSRFEDVRLSIGSYFRAIITPDF